MSLMKRSKGNTLQMSTPKVHGAAEGPRGGGARPGAWGEGGSPKRLPL